MGAHSASTLALSRCADAHSPFLCRLKRAASQRVDGYGVAAQVGQPDHESEPTWDAALAQRGGDEEEELDGGRGSPGRGPAAATPPTTAPRLRSPSSSVLNGTSIQLFVQQWWNASLLLDHLMVKPADRSKGVGIYIDRLTGRHCLTCMT